MANQLRLKPHDEQVMVITGATSGIGLALAREAAKRGTSLFLIARNSQALEEIARELADKGARAAYHAADVGVEGELRQAASEAMRIFGGWDVWVNDAGISIFGPVRETPLEDHRRLFDTNYWGVVNGSLIAVEHLRKRPGGGVLINLGSALGDAAIPVQGAYAASKAAVRGFTEALRMELMRENAPVAVTLIKPSAVATPYKDHAKNLTDGAVKNPPPVYDPHLVAEAILYSTRHRVRELDVGLAGRALSTFHNLAPAVAEPIYAKLLPMLQRDRRAPRRRTEDSLYEAGQDLAESSNYDAVFRRSAFTQLQMRPLIIVGGALGVGAVAGLISLLAARGQAQPPPPTRAGNGRAAPPARAKRGSRTPLLIGGLATLASSLAGGGLLWARRMRLRRLNGGFTLPQRPIRAKGWIELGH